MGGQEQPGVSSHTLRSRMRSRSAQRLEDCETLEHRGPILPLREFLRAPARPQSQVPHLRENARHLHPIQLRDEWQQFRDRSEEHTSELQSLTNLVCRLLLEK